MTIPLWALLGFAVWTMLVLMSGVAFHRWRLIMSKQADFADFPGGAVEGTDFYARATRAHANCLESLPIFGALVLIAAVAGIDTPRLDQLAIVILIARIAQSVLHMALPVTNTTVLIRGALFGLQLFSFLWMAVIIARAASSSGL
ncbi:MAG: MAPEG family protein [Methyloceanibacter sp.]|nr:MAPEG family protein [Methyloceanibacter sp.]